MAIKTTVVTHNPTTKKHEPLAAGDKLAGSIIQLSTDVGQSITTGSDGGLLVTAVAALPDDQVLSGDNTGSVSVTLTPTVVGDQTNYLIKADTKVDPAVGNIATVSSAGVYVPAPVVNASKQVEYGTSLGDLKKTIITFTTPFPSIPFISVTPVTDGSKFSDYYVGSITATGFVIYRGYLSSSGGFVDLQWKAEEK